MASHEGSRKRLKVSRTEGKSTSAELAPVASSSISASNKSPDYGASAANASCHHEQSLKALHTDLDAMRQLVTCKICHRLLYEPYSLSCGHTYCYSCLSQWLVDSRKKTCPDCRAVVTQQPNPSYVIRELVLIFVSRNELLPDGETAEEHHTYVREEAEIVAKDKASTDPRTGGLFKGCFKRGRHSMLGPIHDPGDGVDRCPLCHWELEDGYCNQCGEVVDLHEHLGFSDYDDDSDITDDELDHELDLEDARAVFGADGQDEYLDGGLMGDHIPFYHGEPGSIANARNPAHPRHRIRGRSTRGFGSANIPIELPSSDEDDSEDDEPDENLDGFVVGDDNVQYVSSDEDEDADADAPSTSQTRSRGRRRAPVVLSDDEEDTAASVGAPAESEQDSDDEGPVVRGSQRNKNRGRVEVRQRRARTVPSEEISSDDEDDDHESEVRGTGGFSPLDGSAPEDNTSIPDDYDLRSGYESEPANSVHPMYDENEYDGAEHDARRYATIDDDENDEDNTDEEDDGWGIQAETPSNSRQPPSTSSHRLQPLGRHRNRQSSMFNRQSVPNVSPSTATHTFRPAYPRRASPNFPTTGGYDGHGSFFQDNPSRRDTAYSANHRLPPSANNMTIPAHPFQLGNTLSSVVRRTAANGTNSNSSYNQRNQHIRSNPARRNVSGSSQSSTNGGVDVHSSGSSGSSATVGRATGGRRKRLLSISSDDTAGDARSIYDY